MLHRQLSPLRALGLGTRSEIGNDASPFLFESMEGNSKLKAVYTFPQPVHRAMRECVNDLRQQTSLLVMAWAALSLDPLSLHRPAASCKQAREPRPN